MKKSIIYLLLGLFLVTGIVLVQFNYINANDLQDDQLTQNAELGEKWAQEYLNSYKQLINVKDEDLRKHIAKYHANKAVYSVPYTEADARNVMGQWKSLEMYAKNNNIYPTESEMNDYIMEMLKSFENKDENDNNQLPPIMEAKINELGITIEEYYRDFERYSTIIFLIRSKLTEEFKNNTPKGSTEDEIEYHNRIVKEVDHFIDKLPKIELE